ncbi:MAG TPA: HAMP domain-containing protein, partial [Anaerolineales bacterium]|nr:HAMP domain-containing protein [Anaerolineales bacterium]
MNEISHPRLHLRAADERLASSFYTGRRYLPLLLGVAGAGFLTIYLLARFGALGEPAPQLLYVAAITFLAAIAELSVLSLARQKKGILAHLYGVALVAIYAVLLVLFWQGIAILSIPFVLAPALQALRNGFPRKSIPALLLPVITAILGILYLHFNPPVDRLQSGSPAAVASLVFLLASGILLATIIIISQNRRFRSLQSLLLTAFVLIVTVSTVMTAILSAVGAYTNSQAQIFNSLEAVTSLKMNQIEGLVADSRNDTDTLLADPRFMSSTSQALLAANSDLAVEESVKRTARSRMVDVLGAEEESYNEIMVLDTSGNVIVSTDPGREGTSFADKTFFANGVSGFYVEFAEETLFGIENLIIASPIADSAKNANQGVLILRSNAAHLKEIMETTAGFPELETYLVDTQFRPITRTHATAEVIDSQAAVEAVTDRVSGIRKMYSNYAGQQVLGYYAWFSPMQAAIIAEVPLSFVVTSSLQYLVGSALLAMFVIAVSIAAVVISARAIADPIRLLVDTSENFAAGKFFARATLDRSDEIGVLAHAYNQMADQLQEMIGKLEQRVMDRTHELESQTLRLRVAAEIARDAAAARDLGELLDRTAELICSRFGVDHTGIFLLDKNREYAVLVASPTEAGRKMLENNHKLRVGEIGIVGRVAATGEP